MNENRFDRLMGNQYSITVSDESDRILQRAKENGLKVSQIIDIAIKTMGMDALQRLQTVWRQAEAYLDGETYE
jgi:post-segregation antitoxin (ccd killing protein)